MDGLVLNLAGPSTSGPVHKAVKKGGRWTDRVKARHLQKRNEKKSTKHVTITEPTPTPSVKATSSGESASKRPRTKSDSSASRPSAPPVTSTSSSSSSSRPRTQVISSLFSFNPTIAPVPQSEPGPSKPVGKPSNAPLTDSSTFEGLGLDPLITAHIQTKLGISKPTSVQRASLSALLHPTDADTAKSHSRDAFIQSQTGSGKTLAFLLPIIQDLLPLSSLSYIDRSIGTLAIIIAPTRELAKQISDVLEQLLTMRLRPRTGDAEADQESGPRLTRWLVSGLLTGGSTRAHEKARLRKGVPILVSTPGRLLDHLQNTESFNVSKCRWLVLDEADRLMELGFEETLVGILKSLDSRRRMAEQALSEGILGREVGGWDWDRRRRTILCSATIREDVQKLAGTVLQQPIVIKATAAVEDDVPSGDKTGKEDTTSSVEKFTPPSQLSQKYVVVPLKQRLVALVALLRLLLAQPQRGRTGTRIIVFMSCTDSVDFHWRLLGNASMNGDEQQQPLKDAEKNNATSNSDSEAEENTEDPKADSVAMKSSLFPDTDIYRLHGSLPLPTRLASLKSFSGKDKGKAPQSSSSAILFCTSVASRGLDLPLVRAVVQYDLPTEGGATEYVHRVGRTARAGKGGEAWAIVAPSEAEWVPWVEHHMEGTGEGTDEGKSTIAADVSAGASKRLVPTGVEDVLKRGFGGKGRDYEERATEVQLVFERWVLKDNKNAALARKAFQSHMRAYATHPSDEKKIFHVRHLHLGHLAKAFALRDAPGSVSKPKAAKPKSKKHTKRKRDGGSSSEDEVAEAEAEGRMREAVRAQGRMSKKGGILMTSGTSEFQITGGDYLERLVGRK
ncbi:ATP-dependent RNA helicase dbp7 [Ceratobasidium sp. 428]|nr:ATP-dependent RNA helicase dbp7 [Ceratobasidium sp. 428]